MDALAADRVGIQECLGASGLHTGPVAAEVLVVGKNRSPSGRIRFTLLVSTLSAIQATLTPAPVIPSERAVSAFGSPESVFVVCNASGSSKTLPLEPQAPGMTFGVKDDVPVALVDAAA